MRVLIAYSSLTGNTKKVCEAAGRAFSNVEIKDISDISSLDYDLIIIGSWIDRGMVDTKAKIFIERLKSKKTAFIFTLGAYPDSKHAQDCVVNIKNLLEKNGNEVLGHYHCQGAIDPKLIEMMKSLSQELNPERVKRWEEASEHPDKDDLEKAYRYFKALNI